MRRNVLAARAIDLTVVFALVAAYYSVVLGQPGSTPIQGIFALPLALFVPGYALVRAFCLDRLPGFVETCTLCLGLSILACIFAGFVLNLTPWGIHRETEALFLCALSVSAVTIAFARTLPLSNGWGQSRLAYEAQNDQNDYDYPGHWFGRRWQRGPRLAPRARLLQAGLFLLAFAITVTSVFVAILNAQQAQLASSPIEFWALPPNTASSNTIELGIRDPGKTTGSQTTFMVEVTIGATHQWLPDIHLGRDGVWQSKVSVPGWRLGGLPAQIDLYDVNHPRQNVRQLDLWPDQPALPTASHNSSAVRSGASRPRSGIAP